MRKERKKDLTPLLVMDKWKIIKDPYSWELHELREGIHPKTRKMVKSWNTTWHATVEQCLLKIADRNLETENGDIKEMLKAIEETRVEIIEAMKNVHIE